MKFKQTSVLFLFLLLSAPAWSQIPIGGDLGVIDYTNAKEYELAGITITGVKYLDVNVLTMLSGLTIGERIKIPGDRVTGAVKKLWDQGLFEDVQIFVSKIVGDQVFLNIYLKERPRLLRFSFNGIKKSDADDLREKIRLVKGDYVTDNLIIKTTNIIRNFYTAKGFLNVEVDIRTLADTSAKNEVSLAIDINKNGKVKVYNITVHGNEHLTNEQIKGAFKKTKEMAIFNPMDGLDVALMESVKAALKLDFIGIFDILEQHAFKTVRLRIFKASKFIEDDFKEDEATLVSKYTSLGYRDAKIVRDSISKNPDNTINIDLWVEEGHKYYIRKITWAGNTKYGENTLNHFLKTKSGDVYDKEGLDKALSYDPSGGDIRSLYMDDGYLFFNVVPVEVKVENDSVDLEIRMQEGDQATIDRVTIKGNTKTNDYVALREVQSRPGQLFSRDRLIRSQRQLAQLRYFDAEKLNPEVDPHPEEGKVNIQWDVEETSADQIELSGGWGYGRIVGTLGISFNNFSLKNFFKGSSWKPVPSGDGQKLSARIQTYGKGYLSYSFSFTEPWLGGRKPIAFSVSYVHSKYTNGAAVNSATYGYFKIDGITLGLGNQLQWPDDYFSLYQTLNFFRYNTKNYSAIFSFGGGNGTYNALSYGITLSRNSIDNPTFPRTGSEIAFTIELTPPYSLFNGNVDYKDMPYNERFKWVEYYKWKIKAAWYINLIGKLVLSPRVQWGYLGCYNPSLGITPFERFYLGGDGLTGYNNMDGRELIGMRGYSNNSLTPLYPSTIGGTVYNKNTLELRYPISLNPSATIYVLGFLEAGNDWQFAKNVNPFNLYRSVGLGIRVFLPMFGLLGLDWGYGLDPVPGVPGASGSQFHFSINSSID
jgi:outer membrane protein insertion porin family